MPNLTETPSTKTKPAKVSLAVAAAIAVAVAAVGSLTAIGVADYSATAGDHQLRSERSVEAQMRDACMFREVRWACGVTDVETFEGGADLVVHVAAPGDSWLSHQPPVNGYDTAAAQVQRIAPLGAETVMFVRDGQVIGTNGGQL